MLSRPRNLCLCCSPCLLCPSFCLLPGGRAPRARGNPLLVWLLFLSLFPEERMAPSGGSNRDVAVPHAGQFSGQESTSPPGQGPVEGRDVPAGGARWLLSPEAGRAPPGGRSSGGPGGRPGRPGPEVSVSPVTSAPAQARAGQPRVGECSCLPGALGAESRDQLGAVSPSPCPCCPEPPHAERCPRAV